MVIRSLAAATLAFAWAFPAVAAQCRVTVLLSAPEVYVGEPLLYRARIAMSDDVASVEWTRSPAFPHVRTELLPGDPDASPAAGERSLASIHEERRMLFAERAGTLALAAPDLLCRDGEGVVRALPVPPVEVEVKPLPDGSGGPVVGPVDVNLVVTPREVALGESVRVALRVRGRGNVWDAANPLRGVDWSGAELFETPREIVHERRRELSTRVHYVADVVPRAEGVWTVPAFGVAYFDPRERRERIAATAPVRVTVGPRAEATPPLPEPAVTAAQASPREEGTGWGAVALAGLIVAGAMALVGWRRFGGGPAPRQRALEILDTLPPRGSPDHAKRLADALRLALEERPADASLSALLEETERARFDPEAGPPPSAERVRERILAD